MARGNKGEERRKSTIHSLRPWLSCFSSLSVTDVSPRVWSHYKAKKEKKWRGTVKGPRREEALSYYSPCSTVRAWPAQTRWNLLQKFYKPIGESTVKSKTLNIPAEASPIFVWMMDNKFCPFLWCWCYLLQPTSGAETKFVYFAAVILAP